MEDRIKDTIVLVLMGLVIIFLIWSVNSSIKASNSKKFYQQEIVRRMDLEQALDKLSQEKDLLEKQLTSVEKELDITKETNNSLKKELGQEQAENIKLKEDIDKLNKLKMILEEDLKEALTNYPTK